HSTMYLSLGLLLCIEFYVSSANQIRSKGTVALKTEGEQAVLECTFSTSSSSYLIYWYRQYPGMAPQFILYTGALSNTADFAKGRFSANADTTTGLTTLTISKVLLEDSAVYHCALRDTQWISPGCTNTKTLIYSQRDITSPGGKEEGGSVTFSCVYTGDVLYLQWYRQYPGQRLAFIVLIHEATLTESRSDPADHRFNIELDKEKKRVELKLSSATVTDSALYYCALNPTVTGNSQ
uniref:Ig-like domain-containing protein n=1 Tax=Lepisosteus oculatus TaxID=7918 RepID=W5MFU9_LEPOC